MSKHEDLVTTIFGSVEAPSVNMVILWKVIDMLPKEQRDILYYLYEKDGERTEEPMNGFGRDARSIFHKALRTLRHPKSRQMYLRPQGLWEEEDKLDTIRKKLDELIQLVKERE